MTLEAWLPSVLGILVAIIASGSGWFLLRSQIRKLSSEAYSEDAQSAHLLTDTSLLIVKEYKEQVRKLRVEIAEKEDELDKLRLLPAQLRHLERRVCSMEKRLDEQNSIIKELVSGAALNHTFAMSRNMKLPWNYDLWLEKGTGFS